jgi:hypothetical protein
MRLRRELVDVGGEMVSDVSETTTVTLHSLIDPASPIPDRVCRQRPLLKSDLQNVLEMNIRPTTRAVELFRKADFIFVVDVMTQKAYTLFGREMECLMEPGLLQILKIEIDEDGDELLGLWLLGLAKAVKGSTGQQGSGSAQIRPPDSDRLR